MSEGTMYAWFADCAARHPGAVALEVDGRALTYGELHELAGRIAQSIVRANNGAAPAVVALHAARTRTAYAGYLAALRLGSTVVPLSPSFPRARNETAVRASGTELVLTHGPDPGLPAPAVALEAPAEHICPVGPGPSPDDVAYVLFTSGSTGAPKGVPIRHRNVCAYLEHVITRYGLGPGSRVSQTFDLTFDLSVFDLFAAWGAGATLVVPTRGELLAPASFVARRGITHWFSVPSVVSVAQRLGRLPEGAMPGLKWSLFCGEPFTLAQARAWRQAAPHSTIENLYGPTELTLSCTHFRLPDDPDSWPASTGGTVPIGEPHPGLETLVVGKDGFPAATGELCVRGAQRFGGYLAPADNRGRFMAFDGQRATVWSGPGGPGDDLWYRTGDLVRREPAGLVHLGRLDDQVKVQGYRVEPGEIESALRDQPGVQDAIVVALTDPAGATVLHAVHTGSAAPDAERLLDALRARLPRHMVPRTVTHWPDLPLGPNGKVDRASIRATLARV
ncbi:amino acid adenylation domain-containing protein (plasmid) [Streptomyces sp. CG1]|uniref:amino acid adenylation domain-containing protein n=1 Tax=Streptomyces sp. CG1 TaxID=1287523 RepID=UPI0034E208E7